MIELNNLKKEFKNKCLFDKVNIKFEAGDLVHIKGPNGCGKSTLFKIIADIIEPTEGTVNIDQTISIGAVIENSGFIENEPLLYNLRYLFNLKNTFDEKKVNDICNFFGLDLYSKIKLKDYSIGMRQKVAIIQAVMENQNLILFDEPTRGLDLESIDKFFKLIKQLKSENKIIIIASHDLDDKLDFNKKYIFRNNKIELDG